MNRILIIAAIVLLPSFVSTDDKPTVSADVIVGEYESTQGKDHYKARVRCNNNGTFKAQIYWVENSVNPKTGKKYTDLKNPDRALRDIPCDRIVLFDGLKYNSDKGYWDGCKIYDPQRGLKANLTIRYDEGNLILRGTLMGIIETIYWHKNQ